jgi:hypothetical protein
MRHIHFESSFRRMLGVYVACLKFAPLQVFFVCPASHIFLLIYFQDSISICTRIYQRNMEQLRACTVNAAAILLDDATKIDNQAQVPIIFKSDIDNCLCVPNQAFAFIISHPMSFSDISKRFLSPTCIHVCVLAQPSTNAPFLGLVSAQTPLPCSCLLKNMLAEVWSRCVLITIFPY